MVWCKPGQEVPVSKRLDTEEAQFSQFELGEMQNETGKAYSTYKNKVERHMI